MSIYEIFTLLIAFQFKHWVCDYPLQTEYMLGKFKRKGWALPLTNHAVVHMSGTCTIVLGFLAYLMVTRQLGDNGLGWLIQNWILFCAFDFTLHFIVDRLKAHPDLGGRFKPDNKYFWWALGLDQMLQHLTHYVIIWWLVSL